MALEMSGSYELPVPRERVWTALNDPEMLKRCIPGCEELEQLSPTELRAVVVAKVGPVKARFKGKVTLEDLEAPASYRIVGEGDGGIAGFAKGGAKVELTETQTGTTLVYTAEAQIGGKLAQLGQRLVAGTAKKTADEFFRNFAEAMAGEAAEGA
ncbi:MAG: carbon monoxide dehydrogenase [Rhizobiales bacterium 12-68-15]|nr:MAG: carbon monoxide dehydrogenase [Rhizobiales bacterium 12-68-15]